MHQRDDAGGATADTTRAGTQQPQLGLFDATLLVVGAVVGADIYIVAAIGAQFLGPAQLVAWLASGVLAGFIALSFVQCAMIDANVGGSYAYARVAFGPFAGFVVGWALYAGEWVALSVFPLGVVQYLAPVLPGGADGGAALLAKVVFILAITLLNIRGVRQSASINDVLTLAKLAPLILLIALAVVFAFARPGVVHAHVQPFAPLGWGQFGRAMLPIFWAYAGFELAVLPAGEVTDSRRTLPRALVIGMTIATAFYLLSSAAVVAGLPAADAASSTRPLADTARRMLDTLLGGGDFALAAMTAGAIVAIIGVYDVFTLGLARLSYALARDGLFPAPFASLHRKFGTPYVGILFQGASALVFVSLFDIGSLISTSVLFLSLAYLLTALAALRLSSQHPDRALHLPGLRIFLGAAAASAIFLAAQASPKELLTALVVMLAGGALYLIETKRWLAGRPALRAGERQVIYWERRLQDWLLRSIRRRHAPPRRLP